MNNPARLAGAELIEGPIFQRDVLRFRSFVAHELQRGNVFLMGDAAHTVPPTGAKGMNLAVADVVLLHAALREFAASGSRTAMDAYAEVPHRGTRALVRTVRFRVGDTAPLVQLQAFVVANQLGYALVGTSGEQSFADAE